jgi:hypothetical protein
MFQGKASLPVDRPHASGVRLWWHDQLFVNVLHRAIPEDNLALTKINVDPIPIFPIVMCELNRCLGKLYANKGQPSIALAQLLSPPLPDTSRRPKRRVRARNRRFPARAAA